MQVQTLTRTPARIGISASLALAAMLLAFCLAAGSAHAAGNGGVTPIPTGPAKSTVKIDLAGVKKGRATVMSKVTVNGSLKPFRKGQKVKVFFYKDGRRYSTRNIKVQKAGANYGTFKTSIRIADGNRFGVQAKYLGRAGLRPVSKDSTVHKSWKVRYVGISRGECGRVVRGFRQALNKLALVPAKGNCFNGKMARAVLAYRKLNDMTRNSKASKTVVKRVFNGKGGYNVRRPELGDHMEAPLSKQVIVFSKGDDPYAIFPVASGKASTPTILGTYSFYRKEPGMNSHGMYYSSYFIRGYATHGYESVPDYPASHGCLRTFIADQPRVYDITQIGMPVYTFGNAFRGRVEPYKVRQSGGDLGPDLGAAGGLDPTAFD